MLPHTQIELPVAVGDLAEMSPITGNSLSRLKHLADFAFPFTIYVYFTVDIMFKTGYQINSWAFSSLQTFWYNGCSKEMVTMDETIFHTNILLLSHIQALNGPNHRPGQN